MINTFKSSLTCLFLATSMLSLSMTKLNRCPAIKSSLVGLLLLRLVGVVQGVRHPAKLLDEHLLHQAVPVDCLQKMLVINSHLL